MLPFFRAEISPRLDLESPVLKGSQSFENWEASDSAIRAVVEGQAINIKLRSDWMKLQPRGHLPNRRCLQKRFDAQVIADVFQAKVQRLAVSGSVGLGAAMRAAANSLGCEISASNKPSAAPSLAPRSTPQAQPDAYDASITHFEALLAAL